MEVLWIVSTIIVVLCGILGDKTRSDDTQSISQATQSISQATRHPHIALDEESEKKQEGKQRRREIRRELAQKRKADNESRRKRAEEDTKERRRRDQELERRNLEIEKQRQKELEKKRRLVNREYNTWKRKVEVNSQGYKEDSSAEVKEFIKGRDSATVEELSCKFGLERSEIESLLKEMILGNELKGVYSSGQFMRAKDIVSVSNLEHRLGRGEVSAVSGRTMSDKFVEIEKEITQLGDELHAKKETQLIRSVKTNITDILEDIEGKKVELQEIIEKYEETIRMKRTEQSSNSSLTAKEREFSALQEKEKNIHDSIPKMEVKVKEYKELIASLEQEKKTMEDRKKRIDSFKNEQPRNEAAILKLYKKISSVVWDFEKKGIYYVKSTKENLKEREIDPSMTAVDRADHLWEVIEHTIST